MIRNIFKPSAKCRNSEKRILTHKLIKIFDNRSPRGEHYGTSDSTGKAEEEFSANSIKSR
jgi:hypothetical protein